MPEIRKLSSGPAIELHCDDDAQVRIVPPNNDVMMLTVSAAISACRAYDQQLKFNDQFKQLLDSLGRWLSERRGKIDRAFVTVAESGLMFLVMLKERHYDTVLEDDLTELDIQIANDSDFDLLRLSVLAIPYSSDDALQAFLDAENAVRYHHAK